jgi:FkbH-like protein
MKDKFGDSGITGVIITKEVVENWYIDTFLLSCRIIGRTVEHAFLSFLVNRAREKSVKRIIGEYIPTTKNILVKNFYEKNGFLQADDGLWVFNTSLKIPFPDWIELN